MSKAGSLEWGREAFNKRGWREAYDQLLAADRREPLDPDDIELLGVAAHLIGNDPESDEIRARAYHGYVERGEIERAARCAFWTGMSLMQRGEFAPGSGWLARAHRLLDDANIDSVERGFLLIPVALGSIGERDAATAYSVFEQAGKIGERFGNNELLTLARLGRGQSLIWLGDVQQGMSFLDEAMVGVTSGELSPVVSGIVYCAVIEACQEVYDLRRAKQWTAALTRWCASQPDLVPFRGQCLVHRAEIMQRQGTWPEAMDAAEGARELLSRPPPQAAVGVALYQQAELYRLRGDVAQAEEAYRAASKWGIGPHPGLAMMRLSQGRNDDAEAAIRRVLEEAVDPVARSRVLPSYVEIVMAARDIPAARAAAEELSAIAGNLHSAFLGGIACRALGEVLLAEGEARTSLDQLRRACKALMDVEAPYEAARARVLIGLAFRALGDEDSAEMELDTAKSTFEDLGAAPDLARVQELRGSAPKPAGGLTARELEVLGLIAAGNTNREIAASLVISEKTVARHISNIFVKLGISSRSAATAYAYEHNLV